LFSQRLIEIASRLPEFDSDFVLKSGLATRKLFQPLAAFPFDIKQELHVSQNRAFANNPQFSVSANACGC